MQARSGPAAVRRVGVRCLVSAAALLAMAARGAHAAAQVGMMYEGWQAPAYWGRANTGNNLTVEVCQAFCRGLLSALV